MPDARSLLTAYYDAAAPTYQARASRQTMGWLRQRELQLTHAMIPAHGGGLRALDAGCGPGYYAQLMKERGFEVTAVDISPAMVEKVRELGFTAHQADIERAGLEGVPGAPFDFALCCGVLEFALDVRRFLGALRAQVADGGELVLVAPGAGWFGTFYRSYLKRRGIPARVYRPHALSADLRAVGFEPTEVHNRRPICLAVKAKAV